MGENSRMSDVVLDVNAGRVADLAAPSADSPFRLLLLGDFSGRGSRGSMETGAALASRRLVRVDRDDFDDVLARLAPHVVLDDAGRVALHFTDLDDFHPDRIYEQLPHFEALRQLRQQMADPGAFQAAVRQSGEAARTAAPPRPRSASVLEDILGEPLDEPAGGSAGDSGDAEWQAMLRRIVAPHLVPNADPRQADVIAKVDAAVGDAMRAVLHHPRFQALEALWRALWLLVRRVDTDAHLQIVLLDVSKEELAADLAAASLEQSAAYRLIVESSVGTPPAEPWALIAGGFRFGENEADLALLARMAGLASHAGASFVADADAALSGLPSFEALADADTWSSSAPPGWSALRQSSAARFAGLVAPRFLLREPYGASTDACERFRFEEVVGPPGHSDFLWGSGAFACAMLLAESFAEAGWAMRPGAHREIGGLPLYLVRHASGSDAIPCAELLLTERAAAHLMERGIMPLASLKNQDAVQLVRFQSLAAPIAALAGRWSGAPAS